MKRYIILIREQNPEAWESAGEAEVQQVYAAHHAFEAAVAERGRVVAGSALAPSGAVLSGGAVTDGPYAESVEQVSGVIVIEAESLEATVELGRLLPESYTIEIRDDLELEGYHD